VAVSVKIVNSQSPDLRVRGEKRVHLIRRLALAPLAYPLLFYDPVQGVVQDRAGDRAPRPT
jgi:hypothetical protein